jgi:hypothetical protein
MKPPSQPVEYPETDLPAAEFRRRYGDLIKRKLEELRSAWEVTRDPRLIVDAVWLCRTCGYRRPTWLKDAAAKFPSKKIAVSTYRLHPTRDDSDIGQPPRGRRNVSRLVRERAEQLPNVASYASKRKLAKAILKQHPDLDLSLERTERAVTPVWQRLHPHKNKKLTK